MSIDLFFTQLTQSGNQANGLSALFGVPMLGGDMAKAENTDLFDQIIASLNEALERDLVVSNKDDEDTDLLSSDNPALSKKPGLDVAALLAANDDIKERIEQDVESLALDLQESIANVLELNKQAFEQELKLPEIQLVVAKFPQQDRADFVSFLQDSLEELDLASLDRFEALLQKIETLIQDESPVLLVTNLTPEQMTALKSRLEGKLDTSNQEAIEQAAIDLANIERAAVPTIEVSASEATDTPEESAIPQVFFSLVRIAAPQHNASTNAKATPAPTDIPEDGLFERHSFKDVADKSLDKIAADGKQETAKMTAETATAQAKSAHLSLFRDYLSQSAGSMLASLEDLLAQMQLSASAPNVTGPSPLSNLVTQAQSATQAHPATQAVVATLSRGAVNGRNQTLTLQLDPAELGKIEVRLEFTKDQQVKAHMIIEKPETHVMLQRDSQMLERALQEAGGDASVTFDLADDGHDFSHNGGHDNHNNPDAKGPDGAEGEEEIVTTTMSWYVDPNTGLTRYDFLA